ncbi:replication protein [Clostridium novyi]|uniref:replication protein n=1 Tax=Clostridium novyi TaxID=1542 RepID=UPI0004DAC39D|nr:replication protein [Clostridium novyi]KEI08518.1 replication protein [Clostridium novyi B str. NCTC 9691]
MKAHQLTLNDHVTDVLTNLNNEDIKITADGTAVNMAQSHIDILHKEDDGYITVAVKKKNSWYQYHYKARELKKNIGKLLTIYDLNLYISPNSFYKPLRRIENVRKLNSLYIDMDYYNMERFKNLTPDEIIYILDKDYFKKKVPEASFIVITGRGIAIYWLIESVPYMALPLWNAVQKFLLNELQEVGADPKSIDAARVMRLSGSLNQKSGKLAELLVYNGSYKYNLREIQEEYMPALTPYVKNPAFKRKGRKAKIVKMFNCYSLHYVRLMDLVKLQEMRNGLCRNKDGNLTETGQREIMCFLYRYWSCCFTKDKEKALKDTLEFNKGFTLPLDENTVRTQTRQAEKAYEEWLYNEFNYKNKNDRTKEEEETFKSFKSKRKQYKLLGYNYTNKTLIDILCIIEEEMKHFKTIISEKEVKRRTNIRTNEHNKKKFKKLRRNENGLTKREQEKQDKIQAVKELKDKGLMQKEIAKILKISIPTVKRYYCQIQKNEKM